MKSVFVPSLSQNAPQPCIIARLTRPFFLTLCLAVLFASFSSVSYAQQSKPSEYQIKAVYLYNFSRFVEWPAQPAAVSGAPFAICILGRDPFGPALDKILGGERVEGKSLVTRRISKPQDAVTCQILFVADSEERHLKEILAALDGANVLTVSDIPRFSQRGGMIGFVMEKKKVRFEINLSQAADAGLTLSSDLLKVAIAVTKNTDPGD